MGKKDALTKAYMKNPLIFADAFNKLLYHGEQRIHAEQLKELDTAELAIPYGTDGAAVPEQKYRDVLKLLTAMTDGTCAYCIMGIENQSDIHYAIPVKNAVYDLLQLAHQVSEAAKSHRKASRQKPSAAEYLSGFWKTDKLLPVVTLVVYFGTEKWDAPLSLKEMYACVDETILRHAADYHVNILTPEGMDETELAQFHTNLREVMLYIKYSGDTEKLKEVVATHAPFRSLEREAADVINTVTGSKLTYQNGKERIDMCKAIEDMRKESEQIGERIGTIKGMVIAYHEIGLSLTETAARIAERFGISPGESDETVRKYWES